MNKKWIENPELENNNEIKRLKGLKKGKDIMIVTGFSKNIKWFVEKWWLKSDYQVDDIPFLWKKQYTNLRENIDIESYFTNINFQESIKENFLPIVYSKTEEWYYTNCITSDLNYSFNIWPDLKIWLWKKTNFMWNDFKYFLEQGQVIEKMWWYHNMTNADIKANIIPVEKIKELNIKWLKDYILWLEKDIEFNQEEYKKRVKEVWEWWIKYL